MKKLNKMNVWCVFGMILTYDDSCYELNESQGLLHKICYTEELALKELNILKDEERQFLFKNNISGYNESSYERLIDEYCYIKEFPILGANNNVIIYSVYTPDINDYNDLESDSSVHAIYRHRKNAEIELEKVKASLLECYKNIEFTDYQLEDTTSLIEEHCYIKELTLDD